MNRRHLFTGAAALATGALLAAPTAAQNLDAASQASFDTVMAFMGAMGGGDQEVSPMAADMVWRNEGDPAMPWIGTWRGQEAIFGFLESFSQNVQVTHWQNEDAFASGDTVAVFGRMKLKMTGSGAETDLFTFALRAKARDGKVVLWNWFEDAYAVSRAFHGA